MKIALFIVPLAVAAALLPISTPASPGAHAKSQKHKPLQSPKIPMQPMPMESWMLQSSPWMLQSPPKTQSLRVQPRRQVPSDFQGDQDMTIIPRQDEHFF